ncbi:MAG: M1 family metallopeptidase, partial [Bacteroidota bacterium]
MNRLSKVFFLVNILLILPVLSIWAQVANRWQQKVEYQMEIDMDVARNQFTGKQSLTYYNNSPDTLVQAFYHLYFNAFQPGSMMDVRSRTIKDPDPRVRDRIFSLNENEIGYHKIKSLKQDGQALQYEVVGTILEVELAKPILPGAKTQLDMEFESQVPLQVRRSGRDNAEGVRFSMSQWYPKLCEYDYQGWHPNPYVGREFHGVWGDFDVKISIDPSYVLAASGYIQNPEEVGYGYEKPGTRVKKPKDKKLTWHFNAPQVHDFMWAADPDYAHDIMQVPDGPELHFFYKKGAEYEKNWKEGEPLIVKAFQFMSSNFGKYPYKVFSTVQGGDGGMEYPMATLITGDRSLGSFVGVTVHELIHSWFQGVLGTNESLYAWMDEGFTTYASSLTMQHLFARKGNPLAGAYGGYISLSKSGIEEPLTTHADHFNTNYAYGVASYNKGSVFLGQLAYIVGQEVFEKGMIEYFNTWKFRHPIPNDLIR